MAFEALDFKTELKKYLTDGLYREILRAIDSLSAGERAEEIRLRRGNWAYLTVGGAEGRKNLRVNFFLSADTLSEIFLKMCDGSLYAYSESVVKGYLPLPLGVRVGVCGKATVEDGKIIGVYDISALNVRLPKGEIGLDGALVGEIIQAVSRGSGALIFSPPSEGKTTLLRSLCRELSQRKAPMRIAVVDTREELSLFSGGGSCLDMLVGYPKAEGIRIATLFMNPEVIVCDEIGGEDEALAIAEAQNCGVPLIATTHGGDISSLMRRRGILALHDACVFGVYISIRINGLRGFSYEVYSREEAERIVEGSRNSFDSR